MPLFLRRCQLLTLTKDLKDILGNVYVTYMSLFFSSAFTAFIFILRFFTTLVYIIIIIDKQCSLSHITETIITIITKGTEMRPTREKG